MLQAIRSKTGSWVVKGFLILIALSFAVWGVGDFLSARIQADDKPIEVGEASVSASDLAQQIRQEIQRLAPMFGGRLTPELAKQFGMVDQVVNRVVAETAIDALALDLGIGASTNVIAQSVHAEDAFKNASGQFDPAVYEAVLRNAGITPRIYEELLRDDIRRRQVISAVTAGVGTPDALVERLYAWRNEKRVAETIILTRDNIPPVGDPDEAELQKFYEAGKESYRAPEYRKITAVNLAPELLARDINIDEQSLRATYEERLDDYTVPGRRKLTQVLFEKQEDADAAFKSLEEGRPFDDVATEAAGSSGAIDLGWVTRGDLQNEEVTTAAFEPQVGAYSVPVQSDFGWHIFRVDERENRSVQPFEEVRDEIERQMALDRAIEDGYDLSNKLEDAVGGGATLESAGSQIGVQPIVVDAVDRNGRAPDGSDLTQKFQLSPTLLATAFDAEKGKASILTEAQDAGFFMLRVDDVIESRIKDISEVREQVVADWRSDKIEGALEQLAGELAARIANGEAIGTVATPLGLSVTTSQPFLRETGDPASGITPAMAGQIFELEPGNTATAPSENGLVVARLVEVLPADADVAKRQALADQVSSQIQADVIEELTRDLQKRYDVTINREMINQLF
ncbi:MAG: SurA N-terminal domain-containing protein [Rhodospirillales bacterium]